MIGIVLKNLINKGYDENHIIKTIKFVDEMEKSNLKLNELTNSLNHLEKSKTQHMNKLNKEFNITLPPPLGNQRIDKDLEINLENNDIEMNKPTDFYDESFV